MTKLASSKMLRGVMGGHFQDIHKAESTGSKPVAWCTSVGPAELLRAMGFEVYFPENHGAMLGASRAASDLIPAAGQRGFSPEICSYTTSDVGAYLTGHNAFGKIVPEMKGPPKPVVLVYNTQQCRDVQKWFQFYADEFDVPVFGITPPKHIEKLEPAHISHVAWQFEELAGKLEGIAGAKLDASALEETLRLSRDCSQLWRKCLESATVRPTPWTFFDGVIHMGPAVVLRGTQAPIDYYEALSKELDGLVAEKKASIPDEKLRFYWEGMPVWGRLRALSDLFAELGVAVVASTYCNSWIFDSLDPAAPFESMAATYTSIFINLDDKGKEEYLTRLSKQFGVDGMIYHDARTCSDNSNCRYGMQETITDKSGIPHLVVHGDLSDMRCYSDERTRTDIEAFVEQLLE